MTLAEFLTARLDETERREREILTKCGKFGAAVGDYDGSRFGFYVANYDPRRVLYEVEAKRKILARYVAWQKSLRGGPDSPPPSGAIKTVASVLTDVVNDLAAAHRDHPDWQQDWD